ncbi:MAG: sulfite exporter TauE/SafE family protein [Saprospiraceae bacterium]
MTADLLPLIPIFFIIAILYSSAGFGGGSSYLAVLALFPIEYSSLRVIALTCNIIVVAGAVFLFYKNDLIPYEKVWPLVILSIPMAFLGGYIHLDEKIFFVILGIILIFAALSMLIKVKKEVKRLPPYTNGIIGGGIGFLSGMVGIGGGIFLSPVLYLSRWNVPKAIAATTSLYILVNSVAGLAGQFSSGNITVDITLLTSLGLSVFLGGQIGSRLTVFRLEPSLVKKISAMLILFVGIRILYQNM